MKVRIARFSRSDLKKLGKKKSMLAVNIANLMNQIATLQRLLLFTQNPVSKHPNPNGTAQRVQGSYLLMTLAGVLSEGWQMLQKCYFGMHVSHEIDSDLPDPERDALKSLKRYFANSQNNIRFIRNKYAFHFDRGLVAEALESKEEEVLSIVASKFRGCTYYNFATDIIMMGLLRKMNKEHPDHAFATLVDEIAIKVAGWFLDFGHEVVSLLMKEVRFKIKEECVENPPPVDEVQLPYFVLPPKRNT